LRNTYLVAYDIRDSDRLRNVHQKMIGFGEPIQYSVFICDLSSGELITMKMRLLELINLNEDSLVIVDLGVAKGGGAKKIDCIGKPIELPKRRPYVF
jgi:CRISPR-associated protein Cas2